MGAAATDDGSVEAGAASHQAADVRATSRGVPRAQLPTDRRRARGARSVRQSGADGAAARGRAFASADASAGLGARWGRWDERRERRADYSDQKLNRSEQAPERSRPAAARPPRRRRRRSPAIAATNEPPDARGDRPADRTGAEAAEERAGPAGGAADSGFEGDAAVGGGGGCWGEGAAGCGGGGRRACGNRRRVDCKARLTNLLRLRRRRT